MFRKFHSKLMLQSHPTQLSAQVGGPPAPLSTGTSWHRHTQGSD